MAAAYDTYDYPNYWQGRDYEHKSEVLAITSFLAKIPSIERILEIGAGFGRLASCYSFRAKRVILTDPSGKLLKIAKSKMANDKTTILQSSLVNLPNKIKKGSIDLVIMVRVLHHIDDMNQAFATINSLLADNGYFILEFANKSHIKATVKEFIKGNFTFPLEIFPKDIRSKKAIKNKTLPFINYHPDAVIKALTDNGFNIIDKRSVSNIRSPLLKRIFPEDLLLTVENALQTRLSFLNFGPSIFLLASKSTQK